MVYARHQVKGQLTDGDTCSYAVFAGNTSQKMLSCNSLILRRLTRVRPTSERRCNCLILRQLRGRFPHLLQGTPALCRGLHPARPWSRRASGAQSTTLKWSTNMPSKSPRSKSRTASRRSDGRNKVLRDLGPVALTWAICKSLPRASRGELLAACREAGINEQTAAGQIQQFLRTRAILRDESAAARERQQTGRQARRERKRSVHRSAVPVHVEPEVAARRTAARASSGRKQDGYRPRA